MSMYHLYRDILLIFIVKWLKYVAVCYCSVLQCVVAVCCSVLLRCVAVFCCSVLLQCVVVVCCSMLQIVDASVTWYAAHHMIEVCYCVLLQCVAECCCIYIVICCSYPSSNDWSVLRCVVAVCCGVLLQCVAVCCGNMTFCTFNYQKIAVCCGVMSFTRACELYCCACVEQCETYLHVCHTNACDVTHSSIIVTRLHLWHDSSTRVTILQMLFHLSSLRALKLTYTYDIHICVTWLIHVCGMTSYLIHRPSSTCLPLPLMV